MSLVTEQLTPFGARVLASADEILNSPTAPAELLDLLEVNGVLVFPQLDLDDAQQLEMARRMGDIVVKSTPGWSQEFPGIYRVALDPQANDEYYVKGSWDWHIDGSTGAGSPPKASLLSCRTAPGEGGETEFVNTYTAYDLLTEAERNEFENVKVVHKLREDAYSVPMNLSPEMKARIDAEPARVHPLVWTHQTGRKSLVLGVSASHVEGMEVEAGRQILSDLLDRSSRPDLVLSHTWTEGDLVIWDNRGTLHRARPYASESGRDMHRVNLVGDETIA